MAIRTGLRAASLIAGTLLVASCAVEDGPRPRPEGPQSCPRIYQPVCGGRSGDRQTFPNACEANRAGYRIVSSGTCQVGRPGQPDLSEPVQSGICTREYRPVCARSGVDERTFGNACEAESQGYQVTDDEPC